MKQQYKKILYILVVAMAAYLCLPEIVWCQSNLKNAVSQKKQKEQLNAEIKKKVQRIEWLKGMIQQEGKAIEACTKQYQDFLKAQQYAMKINQKVKNILAQEGKQKLSPLEAETYFNNAIRSEPPLKVERGKLTIKNYRDLNAYFAYSKPRAEKSQQDLEVFKKSIMEHRQELDQVEREYADLLASLTLGEVSTQEAARIEGDWVVPSSGSGPPGMIQVVHSPQNGTYAGIITVLGDIDDFNQYDMVFQVRPVPGRPGSYAGTEYGYDKHGVRMNSELFLVVKGNTMEYITKDDKQRLLRPSKP